MSLTELSLKMAFVTTGAVAFVQSCSIISCSKAPVSMKVQALATIIGFIAFNALIYSTNDVDEPLLTNRYIPAAALCAIGKAIGIVAGNEKLEGRKDYDFFPQFMVTAIAQIVMTVFFNIIASHNASERR